MVGDAVVNRIAQPILGQRANDPDRPNLWRASIIPRMIRRMLSGAIKPQSINEKIEKSDALKRR